MKPDLRIRELMAVPTEAHDVAWLQQALQEAIKLELATLPPYLCGLYALKDGTSKAAKLISGIVFDEMSHFGLSCNMAWAVGVQPRILTGYGEIQYPGPLPGGVRPKCDPTLRFPCDPHFEVKLGFDDFQSFVRMCMQIEYPEDPVPRPLLLLESIAETFPTIGEFYGAILAAFEQNDAHIPYKDNETKQITASFPNVFKVLSFGDARLAIGIIKSQGEGSPKDPFSDPEQQTLSHFYTFGEVYFKRAYVFDAATQTGDWTGASVTVPDAFPMTPVPLGGYAGDVPSDVGVCDGLFAGMLSDLEAAWANGSEDSLGSAIGNMISLKGAILTLFGKQLPRPEGGIFGPQFRLGGNASVSQPAAGGEKLVMTPFEKVQLILDQSIGGPAVNIGAHHAFWRGLTRDQFVIKPVFGLPLISLGHGADSNLIKALKGQAPFGSDLNPPTPGANKRRMPAGLPPVADPDIAFIEQWINDGCPA